VDVPATPAYNGGMTTNLLLALTVAAAFAVAAVPAAAPAAADAPAAGKSAEGTMYHVVSLKLKPGTTPEQVKAVEEAFRGLKGKIPQIKTLAWGTNVSPEKHDKGFTHCFVLTFASAKDRDAYLVHPDHKAFGGVLGPVMADVFVLDFVGQE
jgi:hypothetical protein